MIRASIYGRLGGDPVERTTRNGNTMVTASLAVNAARYGEDEATQWFSLAAFGKQAEALARHQKGDLVAAMGPLAKTKFTGRDGEQREGWSLTVESIVSARTTRPGGKRKSSNGDEQAASADAGKPFNDEIEF